MKIRQSSLLVVAAAVFALVAAPVALAADLADVGIVDQAAIGNLAPFASANQELSRYGAQLQAQFQQQVRSARSDADKQRLAQQYQLKLATRQRELLGPLFSRAQSAIAQVSSNKNLNVVVDRGLVIYGGQDITKDVIDLIQGPGAVAPPVSTPGPSEIGYVDQTQLDQLPKVKQAKSDFLKFADDQRRQAQQKMAAAKNDRKAQQQIFADYQKALSDQQDKALKPVTDATKDAMAKTAKQKNLILVVDRGSIVYGGTDITSDVQNALK